MASFPCLAFPHSILIANKINFTAYVEIKIRFLYGILREKIKHTADQNNNGIEEYIL